jgi:S-adenosylmethionine:tRNA ribosyltransferase-isomerase
MRALESAAMDGLINPITSQTDIFIKPGYRFQIVDSLITNFHLPKSTLLVLISAFIGIEETKKLYKHAVDNEYKFFSYGDACYLDNYLG